MNLKYDAQVDAAYISLVALAAGDVKNTYACDPAEVGGQIQLDFDEAGHLVGIEILNARQLLPGALLKAGASSK
ncbi:MAG TPA: DUF2283 domain-containing protein [Dehalococcoidia bacterium]|nr:DUF2283 domain-containing protein [Dehalococcoidia bacterium]